MKEDKPRASGPAEEEAKRRFVGMYEMQDDVFRVDECMVRANADVLRYAKGHSNLITLGESCGSFWFLWNQIYIAVIIDAGTVGVYHLKCGRAPICKPVDAWDAKYAAACAAANWYVDYQFTHEMTPIPSTPNVDQPLHSEEEISEEEKEWAATVNEDLQARLDTEQEYFEHECDGPEASLRQCIEEWLEEEGLELDHHAFALVCDNMSDPEFESEFMRMPVDEVLRWAENWTFSWKATWLYLALPVKDGIFVIHPDNEEYQLMVECRKFSNYPIGTATSSGDIIRRGRGGHVTVPKS